MFPKYEIDCLIGDWNWSQNMPFGNLLVSSCQCRTFKKFQYSLYRKRAKSVTVTAGGATFTCSVPTMAAQIVSWISACRRQCPQRKFPCEGYVWRVGWCGRKGTEITVNGRGLCGCRARLTIRPCVNSPSWGGFGGNTCSASSQQMSISVKRGEKKVKLRAHN